MDSPQERGPAMTNRSKQKGTSFESLITGYLRAALDDDRIERRTLIGGSDRGDIAGVRLHGQRVVLECKNVSTGKVLHLPEWTAEAHREAGNDDALVGLVVHKRSKSTNPAEQWVTCTVADLVAIITGQRGEQ